MTRREFLKDSSFAALFAAGGCRLADFGGFAVNGIRIGVQMWSVNDLWKKDPAGAFRRLKALGYDGVQSLAFYDMDRKELERMLDGEGVAIVDMPFRMEMVAPDKINAYVEFCQQFGIDFAYDPWERFDTGDKWRRHAEALLAVGEKLGKYGIRVGYHNHQHEMKETYDGKTPFDYLYEAGLAFELDVGHVKLAGGDPVAWMKRLQGRVPSIHAKPAGGDSVGGAGDTNDWPAIFGAAAAAGTKWAVVECETHRDRYDDVALSAEFLKKM